MRDVVPSVPSSRWGAQIERRSVVGRRREAKCARDRSEQGRWDRCPWGRRGRPAACVRTGRAPLRCPGAEAFLRTRMQRRSLSRFHRIRRQPTRRIGAYWALPIALTLAACTITTHVDPVPAKSLSAVCIKENDQVWSKEFLPTLQAEFSRYGIQTVVYQGTCPAECRHHVEYTASWYWDVAVYLQYADVRVYDNDNLIGRATYDARNAWARPDKLGSTKGKLAQIMSDLLARAAVSRP